MKNKILHVSLFIIVLILFSNVKEAMTQPVSGEIINVNYDYKIAFTDLTNRYLTEGDIVEIYKDGEFVTYLQVSQASSAISRLIPVSTKSNYKTDGDFKKIKVGSIVTKVSDLTGEIKKVTEKNIGKKELKTNENEVLGDPGFEQNIKSDYSIHERFKALSDNYTELSKNLSELISQKRQADTQIINYKQQILDLENKYKILEGSKTDLEKQFAEQKTECMKKIDCEKLSSEVVNLKQTINLLRDKLKKMAELIKKGY